MKTNKTTKPTRPAVKQVAAKKTTPQPEMTVVTELPKDANVVSNKKPTAAPQPAPELTIQDIAHFKQILEVVSSRGAFRPNEMSLVGETYAKLTAFLEGANQDGQK